MVSFIPIPGIIMIYILLIKRSVRLKLRPGFFVKRIDVSLSPSKIAPNSDKETANNNRIKDLIDETEYWTSQKRNLPRVKSPTS